MLKLYHLEQSRSLRILWLLEELGLDYELKTYSRDPETLRAPASLGERAPMPKSPIIEDDGRVLVESGAIIDYLTEVKANGELAHGPESSHYPEYRQWLHFTEGSLMCPLVYHLIASAMGCEHEGLQSFTDGEIATYLGFLTRQLERHDYLVADAFSAADVQMSFPLEFAEARGVLKDYPVLQRYLQRLQARPAYRRAREKGGNYDLSVFSLGVA